MIAYLIIIGIFIGVLMLIKSQIKKAANVAFEEELVETEEFTLTKPSGYLTPVDKQFEAYSRDWSEGGHFRKSWAKLNILDGVKQNSKKQMEYNSKDVDIIELKRIIGDDKRKKTFELTVSVVKEFRGEYLAKANAMLDSFKLR
jgi:hypothetical protein